MAFDGPDKKGKRGDGPPLQVVKPDEGASSIRALPNAAEPEKSILSTMLQDPNEYMGRAAEAHITPECFYLPAHSTLYSVLVGLLSLLSILDIATKLCKISRETRLGETRAQNKCVDKTVKLCCGRGGIRDGGRKKETEKERRYQSLF